MMQDGITQADIEVLVAQNPLAAEQLRRIIAERHVAELQVQLADATGPDGVSGRYGGVLETVDAG